MLHVSYLSCISSSIPIISYPLSCHTPFQKRPVTARKATRRLRSNNNTSTPQHNLTYIPQKVIRHTPCSIHILHEPQPLQSPLRCSNTTDNPSTPSSSPKRESNYAPTPPRPPNQAPTTPSVCWRACCAMKGRARCIQGALC